MFGRQRDQEKTTCCSTEQQFVRKYYCKGLPFVLCGRAPSGTLHGSLEFPGTPVVVSDEEVGPTGGVVVTLPLWDVCEAPIRWSHVQCPWNAMRNALFFLRYGWPCDFKVAPRSLLFRFGKCLDRVLVVMGWDRLKWSLYRLFAGSEGGSWLDGHSAFERS